MRILLLILVLNLSSNFIAAEDEKDWWQTTVVSFNFLYHKFSLSFFLTLYNPSSFIKFIREALPIVMVMGLEI
jgi:hypothetical protein